MLFAVLLCLLSSVWADFRTFITLRGVVPGLDSIDLQSTALVLRDLETSHFERHYVAANGEFEFWHLRRDSKYVLTMDSDTLELPYSYLVIAGDSDLSAYRIAEGRGLNTLGTSLPLPLEISGYKRSELVVDRKTFSVFGFIKQPTVLLAFAALAVVAYLPSILSSLDPELLEELQKNEIKRNGKTEKLQNFDLAKSIADRRVKSN